MQCWHHKILISHYFSIFTSNKNASGCPLSGTLPDIIFSLLRSFYPLFKKFKTWCRFITQVMITIQTLNKQFWMFCFGNKTKNVRLQLHKHPIYYTFLSLAKGRASVQAAYAGAWGLSPGIRLKIRHGESAHPTGGQRVCPARLTRNANNRNTRSQSSRNPSYTNQGRNEAFNQTNQVLLAQNIYLLVEINQSWWVSVSYYPKKRTRKSN